MDIDRLTIHILRDRMSDEEITALINELSPEELLALEYNWEFWARDNQLPPKWEWFGWLILAGRGFGKTRAGSEWIIKRAKEGKGPIALIGETTGDVRDTMIEVGTSSIMQVCPPDFMPEYEPSKRRLTFPNGVIATTFSGQEPGQLRGPQHQCFVAGTGVLTPGGEVPIETLQAGDKVVTRFGIKPIEAVRYWPAEVGTLKFSNGRQLCGTHNHPLWSYKRQGWVNMEDLAEGEAIWTGSYLITAISAVTELIKRYTNIATSGNSLMDLSHQDTRYIISIALRLITQYQTWRCLQLANIDEATHTGFMMSLAQVVVEAIKSRGLLGPGSVSLVDSLLPIRDGKLNEDVITAMRVLAPGRGPTVAKVVSTWAVDGDARVYSLQVAQAREYVANGMIVSNTVWCDEPAKWDYVDDCIEQMMYGLRIGKNPQFLATTTPRPIKVIKDWYHDDTVAVTTGSTFDNAENLAPSFIKQMKNKYDGTRMGEQELAGKILWESENALWKQSQIDESRVTESDLPLLEATALALDPTVGDPNVGKGTSKKPIDECGMMLGGRGVEGHGYLQQDFTMRGSPQQWAQKVRWILDIHNPDFIVAEKNQGGTLITETLKAYGIPEARIVLVNAADGKLVRAGPISLMAEQGKIHHVGEFTKLEEELVTYEGKGKSPNRLDALVWLFYHLMMVEQQKTVVKSRIYKRTRRVR